MRQIRNIRDNQAAAGAKPAAAQATPAVAASTGIEKVPEVAGNGFPDNYEGIPYGIVINSLLSQYGYLEGKVPEGVRNTTLYRLARDLRYICDFNVQFIMSVVPDWGLSAEEVKQTISSAITSQRMTNFPPALQKALSGIRKPRLNTNRRRQEYLRQLNPLPEKMPWLLQYIYKRYGRNGRSALVAALPMLGTLLGRLESAYLDGRRHRPVFMAVVCGHAGSGKGFIGDMQNWLLAPILEDDAKGRDALLKYSQEKEKKKGVKTLSEKPTPCIRVLNATSSNGMLMERAQNALGQPLIVITEEIDESARANKSGAWSDKSDIYRKAFDGALWGQDYLTYSGQVRLYANLLFAGTYVSVRNYFSNVENGLMTRFFFTEMARDCGLNVEIRPDKETNDDRKAKAEVQRLYELGSTVDIPEPDNIVTFGLTKAKSDAYQFNADKISEWEASAEEEEDRDAAIDLLRRRAGVVLFRAAEICWALEGNKETEVGREMARWYANESYLNQYIMFADDINRVDQSNVDIQHRQDLAASRVAKMDALTRMLLELPETFTLKDVQILLKGKQRDPAQASTYLTRFTQREMVRKEGRTYTKILIQEE